MKKVRIIFSIIAFALALPASAQIFMAEDELNMRKDPEDVLSNVFIPVNGALADQANPVYTPLGEGILLLTALGGAYLLNKKRKNNE